MSIIQSGNKSHDTTCLLAESARQTLDAAAGGSQATLNSNSVTFYKTVIASGVANGIEVGDFREALHRLTGSYS